jgi:hypothetical protein
MEGVELEMCCQRTLLQHEEVEYCGTGKSGEREHGPRVMQEWSKPDSEMLAEKRLLGA